MAVFKKAAGQMAGATENLCACLVAAMVLLIIADVLGRNLFDTSIASVAEMTTLIQVYIVFLAGSVAVHRGLHFTIVNTRSLYGEAVHDRLRIVVCLLTAGFSGMLGVAGIRLALAQMGQLSPSLQLPYGYFYLSLPLGCGLSALFALAGLIADEALSPTAIDQPRDAAGSVTL